MTGAAPEISIAEFLEFIHRPVPGLVEFRLIQEPRPASNPEIRPVFFGTPKDAASFFTERLPNLLEVQSMGVFFGVAPRAIHKYEQNRGGKKEDCLSTATLWADIDFKTFEKGEEEATSRLRAFEIQPSAIIRTGAGFHCYWKLAEPVALNPEKDAIGNQLLLRIARAIGGDETVTDGSRVLRVPGTMHLKDPNNPRPIRLVEWHPERMYVPSDFANLPQVEPRTAPLSVANKAASTREAKVSTDKYAEAAFNNQIAALCTAVAHTWHAQTYKSAVNLGEFVGAGRLDRSRVEDALYRAAIAAGRQDLGDTQTAIRDGLDKGSLKPNTKKMPTPAAGPGGGASSTDGAGSPATSLDTAGTAGSAAGFANGDHVELAKRLLIDLGCETIPIVSDQGAIWRYEADTGLWREITIPEQSQILHTYSGRLVGVGEKQSPLKLKDSDIKGICKQAAMASWNKKEDEEGFFSKERPGLAFKNGFVSVTNDGAFLEPHSPDNRCRFALNIDFDPDAVPVRFLRYFEEVFAGDDDARFKVSAIQDHVGSCLIGTATIYQRAIVFLGNAAGNGKSQIIDMIDVLFPGYAKSAIPPHLFAKENYAAALSGKRLNMVSEISATKIAGAHNLKAIISGDPITARRLFGAPFDMRSKAGHIFSCNELPATEDLTRGFFRRFVIISFNNSFDESPNRVFRLGQTIASNPSELAGIAAWAIQGAVRVLKSTDVTIPPSSNQLLNEWRANADQVIQFLMDVSSYPIASTTAFVSLDTVYDIYKPWVRDTNHRPLAKKKLGERLKALGLGTRTKAANGYRINFTDGIGYAYEPARHYSETERDAS
jgi:P4 family phage/plasmid primase-like protien